MLKIKKKLLKIKNILFILILSLFVFSNKLSAYNNNTDKYIKNFFNLIKNNDCVGLSKIIYYPLDLIFINNENDFLKNCNIIFDENFRKKVINNEYDFSVVGDRGTMVGNGEVWFNFDGYIIAINYNIDIMREKKADKYIKNFFNLIKNNDCEGLSKIIHYPLKNMYIYNKNDFLKNCNVIFDENFRKKVINNEYDFSILEDRGIMIGDVEVLFNFDGYIMVINYNFDLVRERNKINEK